MKLILFNFTQILAFYTFSQFQTSIQTDRPDQTECPFIVPVNFMQIENGFSKENENTKLNYFFPASLFKYGINEKIELRIISEIIYTESEKRGLNPLTFGFKLNLFKEKGLLPTTSLITHLTTSKLGSKNYQLSYIAPSFRFTVQHTLSKKATLGYNIGEEWNGETPDPTFVYTFTLGYSLPINFGCYIEIYGFKPHQKKIDNKFDGGITYLIGKNLLLDISGCFGLSKKNPSNYIALGCSYRFNTRIPK